MRTPLMVVLAALFLTCTAGGAIAQTLTSDQPDYAPGTTATLTGAGFAPSESVVVVVNVPRTSLPGFSIWARTIVP